MSIQQLSLTEFRNLQSTTVFFHPAFNHISGANGSGKTSLLEAIHVLCQGKSFRHQHLRKCIQHERKRFLLFAQFSDYKVGLSRSEKGIDIRVNGKAVSRRSMLARRTPIRLINAESLHLVTGSAEERRRYLDWCLFHVEPDYAQHWLDYRHALKQRNQLLKTRRDIGLLRYWNQALILPALELQRLRQSCCQQIVRFLESEMAVLLFGMEVELDYKKGWRESLSLEEALEESAERDLRAGFTSRGIHRDNILIQAEGKPASEFLSRGQVKSLSLALLVTSLRLVRAKRADSVILLIDDLRAEMDAQTLEAVDQVLLGMDLQIFVSNIEERIPSRLKAQDFKSFHVERGMIIPRKKRY